MQFSWDFLLNKSENDDSNLQTEIEVHITSNVFKMYSNFKIMGSNPPPRPPNFKSLPYPREGGKF